MAEQVKFKMQLSGHREAMAKYATLDRKMRRVIAGKALRAGAKITVKALRDAAPKASRRGEKALGTKIKTYRNSQITVAITGERIDRSQKDKEQKSKWGGPHFHLIEYGTTERFRTGQKATKRTGMPVGAFGEFGKEIRAAQDFTRGKQRRGRSMTARRARKIMAAIGKGAPTGRVVAKPFFQRAVRSAVPRVQAAQLAVLKREVEAAATAA